MNQQSRRHSATRILATIGAATMSIMGVSFASSAAFGADDDAPPAPVVANIDPAQTGTITVHKYVELGSATQLNPAGPPPAAGYTPLQGVQFTLYKVPGLSVTNAAQWPIFNTLSYNATTDMVSGTGFGPVAPTYVTDTTTDVNGMIAFTNEPGSPTPGLDLGVYLVVEGTPGLNNITNKAAPFFVTLPLPNNNEWLYNVHVYPKNSIASVTKSVSTTGLKVGDTVNWPVTALIPQLAAGQSYSSFSISDTFDGRLGNLAVASVTIDGVAATYTTTGSSGQLMMVNPNLAAVNAAQGKSIVVTFSSTVTSLGADGVIANTAYLNLPGEVRVPSDAPFVRYGTLRIDKFANGSEGIDQSKPLNGASFALYATSAEATAALAGTVGTPLWTGTISSGGTITTSGLYVGDSVNGETSHTYYLVETAAPAGYIRTGTVIPVSVQSSGDTAVSITQVGNTQRPPVGLPLTGSTGTAIFVAGGAGLLLLAGGIALAAARRRDDSVTKE